MRVLVIGSGGREHVLAWKLSTSKKVTEIYVAPGNPGTAELATNVPIEVTDLAGLIGFAKSKKIDLTLVGPEAPLVAGIVDAFTEEGLKIFGPVQKAARLEGSKVFAKNLMKKYRIPTADFQVFSQAEQAITYIKEQGTPLVIKAEGLAAGKGVIVAQSVSAACQAVRAFLVEQVFGKAGQRIIIEEYLPGEEVTVMAFVDGKTIIPLLPSQDHKAAYEGDRGPNTGGMGAYAPAPLLTEELREEIAAKILFPTVQALREEGIKYQGVLYCGLMISNGQARVLEYNVRFGDPEAQVVLPLLKTDIIDIIEAIRTEKLAEVPVEWLDQKALCVVLAAEGYPVKYQTGEIIRGIPEASARKGIRVFQAGTTCPGKELLTAGGRVLTITALANDFNLAQANAYQAVRQISFKGVSYRKDIGWRIFKSGLNSVSKNKKESGLAWPR